MNRQKAEGCFFFEHNEVWRAAKQDADYVTTFNWAENSFSETYVTQSNSKCSVWACTQKREHACILDFYLSLGSVFKIT